MAAPGNIELTFHVKFRDFFLFNILHQFSSLLPQLMYAGIAVAIFISEDEEPLGFRVFYACFIYLLGWLAQVLFTLIYLATASNRTILTSYAVTLADGAVYIETPFGKWECYWAGLLKVLARPGFVALYISGHAAVLIPTRAFASAAQRRQFIETARSRMAAHV